MPNDYLEGGGLSRCPHCGYLGDFDEFVKDDDIEELECPDCGEEVELGL